MTLWTAAEASAATGGHATKDWQATGVSIDTRTLCPGDLFVALRDVRDGHDFVAEALSRGAAAAMVSRVPEGLAEDAPLLVVDGVLPALEQLGIAARARTGARVVAVTGSVGKTSTKEMLRTALAPQGRTHAAEASYNNHWGVPLTLARMPAGSDFAVIEIGMNHPGEIAPLARMARPHVAVITTIAAAHLEAFDDSAGIAREKAAIFEGLEPDGTAVFNGDVPEASILKERAEAKARQVISFGQGAGNSWRLCELEQGEGFSHATARTGDSQLRFRLSAPGRHLAQNALAVLAAVDALGADPARAAADLTRWQPPAGRGTREVLRLDATDDSMTLDLIDDAFNANPASMAAALEVLAMVCPAGAGDAAQTGRRIAILGDMLELGPQEAALHAGLAALPAVQALSLVHCVGPRMHHLWQALPDEKRGKRVDSAEELADEVLRLVAPGDVVLVKGSKGSHVSRIAAALRRADQAGPGQMEDA